jgi:hypothetical protein
MNPPPLPSKPAATRKKAGPLATVLAIFALLLLIAGMLSDLDETSVASSPSPSTSTPAAQAASAAEAPKDRSLMAYIQCKEGVKSQLKSPASADFPWTADSVDRGAHGENSYVVGGHVDAQNSYGANIRAEWVCKIDYSGSGDDADPNNWTFRGVVLNER